MMAQGGHYDDTLVRENGRRRFKRRTASTDLPSSGPVQTRNSVYHRQVAEDIHCLNVAGMLESHTLRGHFVRGVVGLGFLAIMLVYGSDIGWWTLIPAAGAVLTFRG